VMNGAPRQRAKSRVTMQGGSYELSFFLSKAVSEGNKSFGIGSVRGRAEESAATKEGRQRVEEESY
jgi:hypothetical protein